MINILLLVMLQQSVYNLCLRILRSEFRKSDKDIYLNKKEINLVSHKIKITAVIQ